MRWPVFAAIVPEVVPRAQLPAALALNGVSMNASRIIGPLVAGALIAAAGSAWVFALNAVLSMIRRLHHHALAPRAQGKPAGARAAGQRHARRPAVRPAVGAHARHSASHRAVLPALHRAAGAAAPGRAQPAGRAGRHLHRAAGVDGRGRHRRRAPDAAPAQAAAAANAAVHRHRLASRGGARRCVRAQHLRGGAGDGGRRHGLDHRGQLAHGGGPDGLARLGARARHVDLPDGPDGLHRARRGAVGPGRDLDQHPRRPGDRPGLQRRVDGPGPAPGGRPRHRRGPDAVQRLQGAAGAGAAKAGPHPGQHRIPHRPGAIGRVHAN